MNLLTSVMKENGVSFDMNVEVQMEGRKHLDIAELEWHHETGHLVVKEAKLDSD